MIGDLRLAKKLYKQAIRRCECPKGAYQQLCSIYLNEATAELKGESVEDSSDDEPKCGVPIQNATIRSYLPAIQRLIEKIKNLDDAYGCFLCYDPEYSKIRPKLAAQVKTMQAE